MKKYSLIIVLLFLIVMGGTFACVFNKAEAQNNSCLPTGSSVPCIEVLSPNGKELFTPGQQVEVLWRTNGIPETANIQLYVLYDGSNGGQLGDIALHNPAGSQNFQNDGSEVVILPTYLPWAQTSPWHSGKYYKLYITYMGFQVPVTDYSNDTFTITTQVTGSKTIAWFKSAGAKSYEIQVFDGTDLIKAPVLTKEGLTTISYPVPPLPAGETYYWRVRAISEFGSSPWSGLTPLTTITSMGSTVAKTTLTAPVPYTGADLFAIRAQFDVVKIEFAKLEKLIKESSGGEGVTTTKGLTGGVVKEIPAQVPNGGVCEYNIQCLSWLCKNNICTAPNFLERTFGSDKGRQTKAETEFEGATSSGGNLKLEGCGWSGGAHIPGTTTTCYCTSGGVTNVSNILYCGGCSSGDPGGFLLGGATTCTWRETKAMYVPGS
jgi:hypothetical protein